jgi:Txe/YoeB family toxin of toxin-antitoxin system
LEKWRVIFSNRALKDWQLVSESKYREKVIQLLNLIEKDPFQEPPPLKRLQGDMKGAYSRRINHQHRLVYRVDKDKHIVNIIMMWLHYE